MPCSLFNYKFLIGKQVLALLRDKSLATVTTVIDLWLVQIDIDLGVSQCPLAPIAPSVGAPHHGYRLFCQQRDCKLLVHLDNTGMV